MQLWGLTDPGNLREQNQDSYAMLSFSRDRSLMIVCDGMGGAKSGNVASSLAVEVFTEEVRRARDAAVPIGRVSTAEDIAKAAYFLASDESGNASGTGLIIDGGMDSLNAGRY